ncbi:MAG: hypothetical protein A2X56_02850 [Nitrospirae bacterium GWC2_57_13]|jgi:hypothetical protein|nr:MAG: hypothetical protein A2X56_02850 [Nitrospirae bacterium GWC2_57_13]OGW40666.1 MAG: hypothetical protein A2X57_03635 [Nitrospirae bacterium GWD2_57_8]HAS54731.1 hypothetical protein [Nitrospiraceae bacterium]
MINSEAARRVAEEFGASIEVIKKTSKEYGLLKDPLPCPSVAVNGRLISINDIVTEAALREAIEAAR